MNEPLLPTHVIEKVERRWASRLAREGGTWRAPTSRRSPARGIVDRAKRLVSVTSDADRNGNVGRLTFVGRALCGLDALPPPADCAPRSDSVTLAAPGSVAACGV